MPFLLRSFTSGPRCKRLVAYLARPSYASYSSHAASATSFESLGVDRTIVRAVKEAFPNVQEPTATQRQFIPAILEGKDVLLRDQTGTGKSFGLLLALLNQDRQFVTVNEHGERVKKPLVTSLVLTPHRDLAYQFLHWMRCILAATPDALPLPNIGQVVLRGASPIASQVEEIHSTNPQVLIGTPQAVLEAMQLAERPLSLSGLSAVVVDEADYLLELVPKTKNKHKIMKAESLLRQHPSPTRQILDSIYSTQEKSHRTPRPQLVLSSATLRAKFIHSVMSDNGWLTSKYGDLVKVMGTSSIDAPSVDTARGVMHCAVVVKDDGQAVNIQGALNAPVIAETDATSVGEPTIPAESTVPAEPDQNDIEVFGLKPSPFNPAALEAIAVAFAVDVPYVALLVIPADASVRRAVFDLRTLGVNAHNLDVAEATKGGGYLLRKDAQPDAEPTLLVSTLATVRGLDLPELSHVFLLGIPRALTADAYLHVAGRVGRFGKGGKVVAVVEERREIETAEGKSGYKDEPAWLKKIYERVGVTPTKFEHFEDAAEHAETEGRD